MRVILLTNSIVIDKPGGLYRYVWELATALAASGVDVVIATKRVSSNDLRFEQRGPRIAIHRYSVPSKKNPFFAVVYPFVVLRVTLKILRTYPDAALHAHYPVPAIALLAIRRKYVYTFHAPVYKEIPIERAGSYYLPATLQKIAVLAMRRVEGVVVNRAVRCVTLSDFMSSEVKALPNGVRAETEKIAGGVDTDFFCPGNGEKSSWEVKAQYLLVCARRLVERTGVAELVGAMPKIREALPGARLIILGSGPLEDEIRGRISELGINECVRMYGQVVESELLRCLRVPDIAIMPTQTLEGFGLASAEALSCGTPVVGTPGSANREVIGGLDRRLLSDGYADADIAAATVRTLIDHQLYRDIKERSRQYVHPRWSWNTVAQRYMGLYQDIR